MGALSIRDVRKAYHGTEILKGINIEIEEGEFLIPVGPSGCGKSTLLSMIAGLDSVSSGEIHIADRQVTHLSPKDRDIAMVFQSYALYPSMTVRENISFGLEIRKVPKAEREAIVNRVAGPCRWVTCSTASPRSCRAASVSGSPWAGPSRVIRRCSCSTSRSPTSTPSCASRCVPRSNSSTTAWAPPSSMLTHDQIEAMTLGDKIAVMKAGEVQQFGSPQEIYDNPANLFVAGFLMGSPSMNFIPARVEALGSGHGVRLSSGDNGYVFQPSRPICAKGLGRQTSDLRRSPQQITHRVESAWSAHIRTTSDAGRSHRPTGPDTLVLGEDQRSMSPAAFIRSTPVRQVSRWS